MPTWDDDLEIRPRQQPKPEVKKFVKTDIGSINGKSSKYLREVTIPYLRVQITMLKQQLKKAREGRKEAKETKSKAVKDTITRVWTRKKKAYGVTERAVNKRAREYYYDKVKSQRIHNANYLDGISAYPILQQQSRMDGVPYKYLGMFILINHFEWFQLRDGEVFGYNYNFAYKTINTLIEYGMVEKFTGKRNSYVVTLKGQKKFESIVKYYKKQTKMLFKEWDKKMVGRTGRTNIQINHKLIERFNLDDD